MPVAWGMFNELLTAYGENEMVCIVKSTLRTCLRMRCADKRWLMAASCEQEGRTGPVLPPALVTHTHYSLADHRRDDQVHSRAEPTGEDAAFEVVRPI